MPSNRPAPIFVCGEPPAAKPQRYFAKAKGQEFEARSADGVTRIDLFDEIGDFGVSAKDFISQLDAASGDVVLRINSPGGDVFAGIAIYNALVAYPEKVRVEVTGVAASAASIIAMAGDEIAIAENAFVMIHNAWGVTIGNQEDHDEASDLLGQIDQSLANTYARKTGLDVRAIVKMMAAETWFNGADAKANGFATEIITAETLRARFDVSIYAKAPPELTGIDAVLDPHDVNIREVEKILRDAGIPRPKAKSLAAHGFKAANDLRDAEVEASDLAALFAAKASTIQTTLRN